MSWPKYYYNPPFLLPQAPWSVNILCGLSSKKKRLCIHNKFSLVVLLFGSGMSPQRLMCATVERWWKIYGMRPRLEKGQWGGVFLEEYILFPPPLLPGCHEVSTFALPCHDVLSHHGPKSKGASRPWTEISETELK